MSNKYIIEQFEQIEDDELPFALNTKSYCNQLESMHHNVLSSIIFNIKPPFETLTSNINTKKCNQSLYITYNKPKMIEYKGSKVRRKTI